MATTTYLREEIERLDAEVAALLMVVHRAREVQKAARG